MARLTASAAAHLPILIDLTIDPEQIPADHPEYETYGLGNPDTARSYRSMLLLANIITVANQSLMTMLKNKGHPVMMVPDGWSRSNPHWATQYSRQTEINLGWIGRPGQHEDVADIRRIIVRVLREFPNVRLIIAGDQSVYHLFESIPRSRCQFFPLPHAGEFPKILNQIDLLFKPLRNTPFNHTLSDRLLVAACAKGIPWIASPVPAVIDWGMGGMIAHNTNDWHKNLIALIMNRHLRERLGREGQQHAQVREISHLKIAWLNAIKHAQCIPA
jgi:glycosyltransferase involved in cell wall biosynthesis